jgi:hypothetical protein
MKVDEYHTSVAHFRAWRERLQILKKEQEEQEKKKRGPQQNAGSSSGGGEEDLEEKQENLGEKSVGDLIGLLSPVDALCDDPIIAGAFKQFGINFEGEPPSPPAPRITPKVQMERKNGVIVMKRFDDDEDNETLRGHGKEGNLLTNAERRLNNKEEADQQDIQKICEDFGRLFASCNVKCGVPSVMISKIDFGDVLKMVSA